MQIFLKSFEIFIILIMFVIIYYVIKIEKKGCGCASSNWDFQYIKFFTIALAIIYILNFIWRLSLTKFYRREFLFLTLVLLAGNLIYIYAIFKYLKRTKKCKCFQNKPWQEKVLFGYGTFLVVIYISLILSMTLLLFYKKNKQIQNIIRRIKTKLTQTT